MKSVFLTSLLGRIIAKSTRIRGGHGSALPGLIAEKIDPKFLKKVLEKLPCGVAVISGTNGKTTTTKIAVELLRAAGLRVFTNPSGSNFTRGVASSAIAQMRRGKLNADIAILELDEAHAVHFVNKIAPKYSLLLNVFPDQTERFSDVQATAKFLEKIAAKTTGTVILNREDSLVSKIPALSKKFFGYSRDVSKLFFDDKKSPKSPAKKSEIPAEIVLESFDETTAKFNIGSAKLQLGGAHNALNAAAALVLVKEILDDCHPDHKSCHPELDSGSNNKEVAKNDTKSDWIPEQVRNDKVKFDAKKMLAALSKTKPAYGRGENFVIGGQTLTLNLVKNADGFQIVLASQHNKNAATMIAINDQIADGRDVSWLADVDFSMLKSVEMISGTRAADMAQQLKKQNISIGEIDADLPAALAKFLKQNPGKPKQIFATYTAMLLIRKILKKRK